MNALTYDADLEHRFMFHPADKDTGKLHDTVRESCHELATTVVTLCPPGRERSLAITKLEEAMMWANAAIARGIAPGQFDPRSQG